MASIASRASWGARRSNGDRNLSGLASAVVLHHTVTAHPSSDASVSAERQIMRQLEDIGNSRFGSGISYNVLVFPSGRAYQGVSFNRRGTHTGGHNSTVRSICFVGNYEANQPTKVQLETAASIVAEGRGKWWSNGAPVRGHRDYSQTACPGKNVYSKRGQIASGSVTGGSSGGGGTTYTVVGANEALGLYDKDGSGRTRIADWQTDALGYDEGEADGLFGPATETDTKALQKQIGLTGADVDGMVGPDTITAWEKAGRPKLKSGGSKPSKPAPSKPEGKVPGPTYSFPYERGGYIGPRSGPNRSHSGIGGRKTGGVLDSTHNKRFISQLGKRGWNISKGGPYLTKFGNDGKYGNEMAALIGAFQKDQGLTVDNLAGKATWDAAFKNPVT